MQPEEIAARVWPGRELEIEPLGGGITNRNFKVTAHGEAFVLRIGGKDTELLGIDRGAEHAASCVAAELGLGPEVVAFVEPEGYLVTRYVDGEVGKVDVALVGAALRRLHDGPLFPGASTVFASSRPTANRREHGVPCRRVSRAKDRGPDRTQPSDAPLRPCHNDLLSANFIDDGERLWLVDWEYAGMGDRFFDLANFAVNHELAEEGENALLAAYGSDDGDALVLMRFMSDFREAMWGVVQQAISELDFDFVGYAEEHFERLEHTASEPAFRRAGSSG